MVNGWRPGSQPLVKRSFLRLCSYLDRLHILPYDKVEMTWLQAQMVCGLRPGLDGNYYGVIAAQQLFKRYLDNQLIYQDVTERGIEVVLTRYEVYDEGESSDGMFFCPISEYSKLKR